MKTLIGRMRLRLPMLALLGSVCLAAPSPAASPPSWPRFHGPQNDNLSSETGLLKQWPDGAPTRLWTAQGIGEGFSAVSLAHGLIYATGNIQEKTVITALDLAGKVQWQVVAGKAWKGSQPGTRSTPTIDGDRLYHESPLGDLVCLEAKTGRQVWGLNVLDKFGSENITWALSESPLIDGQHVICCPGGPQTAVVALDKTTGQTVWQSASAGNLAGYSSPALAEYQGLRMILTMTAKAVIGVNADTGDLLWQFEHVTPWDESILTPIFHEGRVFISTGHRVGSVMLQVKVDGKQASVEPVWKTKDLDNHHGGTILLDGYLYGSCYSPRWACLDWQTGKKQYSERGVGKGALTYADGRLYTFSENEGEMGLVKATPEGHQLISRFKVPAGGEGPSWAHPVVCGGRLYLRHGDFLYVYDIRL
ncbi:MAG: PQQ-like beta-propeller repeat protein [Planctomycetota bacterium]|nr:PQQ-like beta-propeller repeat protein [Planctomycetota bacterium]